MQQKASENNPRLFSSGGVNVAAGNGNIRAYKKPINLNIGMIFFAVILLYVIICVFIYFNKKQIYGYEVKTGSLSETNVYEAIALREESVITSTNAGYINYFAKEGERIGAYQLVCTVDESGQILELVDGADNSEVLLSEKDLLEIRGQVADFAGSFNKNHFSTTYDFKFNIDGSVLKFANSNLLNNISSLYGSSVGNSINVCNAPESGIVIYSVDGYEDKTASDISKEWFEKENYEKVQLINNDIVENGDAIFKLATDERWSLLFPLEKSRADELLEEEYVKVRFLKNQNESWGKVSVVTGTDNETYVQLTFTNSMITFATDRYVDIELILDVESGLKVPNSAIVEKEFFLIPTSFVQKGGKNANMGVLRETYNEDGSVIPEFIEVTIYNEENGEYYLDDSILRAGDNLLRTDSNEKHTVSKSGTLVGVYNINKGYADFKQIQILNQNDEYSIIKSNTQYGLIAYDHIVLDAESVNEDEFIYD